MAACAEALESLDRFSLDEVAFDETIADMQDAAGDGIPDTGDDVEDARDEADVEKGDDEGNGQPEPNAGDETSCLATCPSTNRSPASSPAWALRQSSTRPSPWEIFPCRPLLGTRSRGSSS